MSLLSELYQESIHLLEEIVRNETRTYIRDGLARGELRVIGPSCESLDDRSFVSKLYGWIDDALFRNKKKESQLGWFILQHREQLDTLYKCDFHTLPKMAIPIPAGMKTKYLKTAQIFEETHFSKAIPDLYLKMEKVLSIVRNCIKHPKDSNALQKFRECYYPTIGFLEKLNAVLHHALEETFEIKERNILNISLVQEQFRDGKDLKNTTRTIYKMISEAHEDIDRYGSKIKELFGDFHKVIMDIKNINPRVMPEPDLLLLKKIVIHDAQIWTLVGQFIHLCYELDNKYTMTLGKMCGDDPTDWRK